jgi:hypothetical protein
LGGSSAAADGNGQNQTVWCSVMMLSCVPMVLSSVYKESALRGEDIDVVYLNGWVAVFQFAIGLPLLWPSALASNLPLADLAPNLVDGFWCFMGKHRARSKYTLKECGSECLCIFSSEALICFCIWGSHFFQFFFFIFHFHFLLRSTQA